MSASVTSGSSSITKISRMVRKSVRMGYSMLETVTEVGKLKNITCDCIVTKDVITFSRTMKKELIS